MQVEHSGIATAGSTLENISDSFKWLGRTIVEVSQSAWEMSKTAVSTIASTVATIWTKVEPAFSKVLNFVISPLGVGIGLTALAGVLASRSSDEVDELKRSAMQGASVCSALIAGILVGKFSL